MNHKKSLKVASVAALALTTASWNQAAEAATVTLNGQPLATSVEPLTRAGRTLVPMRDIFEALGASVQWNSVTQGILATRGRTTVDMQIGEHRAHINRQRVRLDQAPMLYQGSTMVPLRFVSEALGAHVDWNARYQVVAITTRPRMGVLAPGAALPAPAAAGGTGIEVASDRSITVPSGAVVPVTLDATLSSKTAQVGQTFMTTVVSSNPGDAEFPPGTKIEGVITEVRRKTGSNPGMLDVDFRAVVLPNGERHALRSRLTSLDDDSVTQSPQGDITARKSEANKDQVKIIGIGAGAGFLIGKVLLQKNGVLSAVLGAAGGYLYNQHQNKNRIAEVSLSPGTKLGVRLDRSVTYADRDKFND